MIYGRYTAQNLERVKGIEPSLLAWEAKVLPLNYTREALHYQCNPNLLARAKDLSKH